MASLVDYIIYMTYDLHGQMAGCIANAEIESILANSSRVNRNFIHLNSNTNIFVYDNTQWVGCLSDGIKVSRASVYRYLAMGGTYGWATDFQEYNDAPFTSVSWSGFIGSVLLEVDSSNEEGNRTGNWTTITRTDPAIQVALYMPSAEQWSRLGTSNAWSDTINVWQTIDEPKLASTEKAFSDSVMNTYHLSGSINCGITTGNCDPLSCASFEGFSEGTGDSRPAAMLIYESFAAMNVVSSPHPLWLTRKYICS
ncbi:Glycoside hydrolase superfamily [Penicillium verhagenii]|uniref:Glycoside hydrolase superfamily n=1 Tax=Penicillium verhagenii TaxID=1562060 RepID=UPI0025451E18|nr:Glycoside hydrolase superfamily [Penicillium verhagenii]KAJ5927827.1 Glycoside hydrolase superfamily [Penicillium verhagenii]